MDPESIRALNELLTDPVRVTQLGVYVQSGVGVAAAPVTALELPLAPTAVDVGGGAATDVEVSVSGQAVPGPRDATPLPGLRFTVRSLREGEPAGAWVRAVARVPAGEGYVFVFAGCRAEPGGLLAGHVEIAVGVGEAAEDPETDPVRRLAGRVVVAARVGAGFDATAPGVEAGVFESSGRVVMGRAAPSGRGAPVVVGDPPAADDGERGREVCGYGAVVTGVPYGQALGIEMRRTREGRMLEYDATPHAPLRAAQLFLRGVADPTPADEVQLEPVHRHGELRIYDVPPQITARWPLAIAAGEPVSVSVGGAALGSALAPAPSFAGVHLAAERPPTWRDSEQRVVVEQVRRAPAANHFSEARLRVAARGLQQLDVTVDAANTGAPPGDPVLDLDVSLAPGTEGSARVLLLDDVQPSGARTESRSTTWLRGATVPARLALRLWRPLPEGEVERDLVIHTRPESGAVELLQVLAGSHDVLLDSASTATRRVYAAAPLVPPGPIELSIRSAAVTLLTPADAYAEFNSRNPAATVEDPVHVVGALTLPAGATAYLKRESTVFTGEALEGSTRGRLVVADPFVWEGTLVRFEDGGWARVLRIDDGVETDAGPDAPAYTGALEGATSEWLEAAAPEPGVSGRLALGWAADDLIAVRATPAVVLHNETGAANSISRLTVRLLGVVELALLQLDGWPDRYRVELSGARRNRALRVERWVDPDAGRRLLPEVRVSAVPDRVDVVVDTAGSRYDIRFPGVHGLSPHDSSGEGYVGLEPDQHRPWWHGDYDPTGPPVGVGVIKAWFDALPPQLNVLQVAADAGGVPVLARPPHYPDDDGPPVSGAQVWSSSAFVLLPSGALTLFDLQMIGWDRDGVWTAARAPLVRLIEHDGLQASLRLVTATQRSPAGINPGGLFALEASGTLLDLDIDAYEIAASEEPISWRDLVSRSMEGRAEIQTRHFEGSFAVGKTPPDGDLLDESRVLTGGWYLRAIASLGWGDAEFGNTGLQPAPPFESRRRIWE